MRCKKAVLLGFALALIMLAGCTGDDIDQKMSSLTNELKPHDFTLSASQDIRDYPPVTCLAMI
ncbi:MAG: hypothetical protein PHS02_02845, partial [Candidatus ainarchaeum sp.]|nr:hypothetical protein [Candidatus ainarchaeum sp.]